MIACVRFRTDRDNAIAHVGHRREAEHPGQLVSRRLARLSYTKNANVFRKILGEDALMSMHTFIMKSQVEFDSKVVTRYDINE